MNTSSTKTFNQMTVPERWQHHLRRKFQELENSYYPVVDDLSQKLADMDGIDPRTIPDFSIHQFQFIKEWQDGDVNSQYVLSILNTMDMEKVAVTQLTRRLTNFLLGRQNSIAADYIFPCRAIILSASVPVYIKYLGMLKKYFERLVEIDRNQEKVTWIEQLHRESGIEMRSEDMTLNQVVRQLNNQVMPFNNTRYSVGENLLCMDEELAHGTYAIHWISAPQSYIAELKKTFKITDVMDIGQEAEYIKKIIGTYINEKV